MTETYDVTLTVGDWSRDGHNKFDQIRYRCNRTRKQIEAAYKAGAQMIGFDLTNYCQDYEDSNVPASSIQKLSETGARLPRWTYSKNEENTSLIEDLEGYRVSEDDFSVEPELFADLYLEIARVSDPELEYEQVPVNWENEIHIGGYGLFFA